MTFKQYRTFDLSVFMLIYAICEWGIIKVGRTMIDQPYIISLMLPMLLIVMIRWDKLAIYQAIISACLFVLYQQGDYKQMIVYILGNLGVYLMVFPLQKYGKERINKNAFDAMAYVVIGAVLMEVFRYFGMTIIYQSSISTLIRLMSVDALSVIFGIIVLLVGRKMDGLIEDQKSYLLRLNEEKVEETTNDYYM